MAKSLITNRVFHFRTPNIDSYGNVTLDTTASRTMDSDHYGSGYKRMVRDGDNYYAFLYHGKDIYYQVYDELDSCKWRRVDILAMRPAREIYFDQLGYKAGGTDSFDSALEVVGFLPINFHMDSIHSFYDSTQSVITDSDLVSSWDGVLEHIALDSNPIENSEIVRTFSFPGFAPAADSNISFDSDFLYYGGRTFRKLEKMISYSMRESSGNLVVQPEDDYNVYSSYRDSVEGIDVIYFNTTANEWQHRNFSDDSATEGWEERSFFIDSGVTSLTASSDSDSREHHIYSSALPYFLRDTMGMYHFPDFRFKQALDSLQENGEWKGTLDSLGSPWDSWTHSSRGFDFVWHASANFPLMQSVDSPIGDSYGGVIYDGINEVFPNDEFLPLPLAVIGIDSAF